jgi:hypothetical protein
MVVFETVGRAPHQWKELLLHRWEILQASNRHIYLLVNLEVLLFSLANLYCILLVAMVLKEFLCSCSYTVHGRAITVM